MSPAVLQAMRNQNAIHEVIEPLLAGLDPQKVADLPGYAGVVISPEQNRFTLYWKGTPPANITKALASLPAGMTAEVVPASYSRAELNAQIKQIRSDDAGTAPEYRAHRLVALEDGSGIEISVSKAQPSLNARRANRAVVRTLVEGGTEPLARQNDSAPYYGGARLQILSAPNQVGAVCSSGFIVRSGSTYYTTSAAHCGSAPNAVRNGAGATIGSVAFAGREIDSMLINLSPNSASARVYDGAWNNGSGYNKPVVGQAGSAVGDLTCTSGSFSGVVCGVRVTSTNASSDVGGWHQAGIIEARQDNGGNAAGDGDSGGPVFSLASNPDQVIAKGIISGGRTATVVGCTGVPTNPTRKCYNRITIIPISMLLSYFRVSLATL
ncbi:hypothetical protein GCM10010399_41610 [Dactylosporangium fulvum]|uniref:S1 family peptidase n=1 Tax=Dactylosporangium fulvum TaxID=53359 RepID=A0ABY5VXD2_9ACTN|nr:S1 family peptidase [Dactylosporangium fulvum]UWP82353.1 S1 family peptidase [Dactylosporangium fulvum]